MTEYLKFQQIYSLIKLVETALSKNHIITGIFFFGTGVLNLQKKAHFGKNTRDIPQALEQLAKKNIPIYACQTWADNYGIHNEDIIPGAEITGLGELSNLTAESDKMIVFGTHT